MSKFANTMARPRPDTVNSAGGVAYKVTDAKKELADVILSSMLKGDTYYQSDADRIDQVFNMISALDDKEFAAKAMIYARQEGNLRSISHVLANAVAENNNGKVNLRSAIRKAVVRPDDMIEMFALWRSRHNKMLPNAMRRAFADLLESNKWDAYQLKKYARTGQDVKLRDVILMSHPKDNRGMLGKVIDGTLKAPATVENMLSSGKKASETFSELLKENRLGYMAAVKNIRNALETGISDADLELWSNLITNRKMVLKSRMLPFRFVDAWESVKDLNIDHFKLQKVKDAFDKALVHSAMNLGFINEDDRVALVIDESGSMSRMPWKNAITLAAVLYHALPKGRVVSYKFGSDCTKLDFGFMSPLDIIFNTSHGGCSTYFSAPLKELIDTGTYVDKIIMLTDMQLYSSYGGDEGFDQYWKTYKSRVSPKAKMLFWDLNGYGSGTPLDLRGDVLLASGFSDKLLSVIPKMWKNQDALVEEIEAIKI
jgi:hypothetical protein